MATRDSFLEACTEVSKEHDWGISGDRFEVSLPGERSQTVEIEFFDFEGDALVRFVTTIGSTARISPLRLTTALQLNYGLPHGSLAVKDESLVMVQTLRLEDAKPASIAASVQYLAQTADHFEAKMFGGDRH